MTKEDLSAIRTTGSRPPRCSFGTRTDRTSIESRFVKVLTRSDHGRWGDARCSACARARAAMRMFDVWSAWRAGVGDTVLASQSGQDTACH